MRDSFTSCINNPNISLSNPYIPGVAFQSSNCSSLMAVTIDNSCTISMDMSNGAKTGWDNSYKECTSASNTASNNDSGSNNKISNWAAYTDSLDETTNLVPSSANSSCEDSWAGTAYTGKASFARDSDPSTKWPCNNSGKVAFERDNKELIK